MLRGNRDSSDQAKFFYQLSEEVEALSSNQVTDEGGVTEISVDLQSLPASSGLKKRPILHKHKLAQSLADLETELAAKLRQYTKLRLTKQEKLTGLQAVYFNLQIVRLNITGMFSQVKSALLSILPHVQHIHTEN